MFLDPSPVRRFHGPQFRYYWNDPTGQGRGENGYCIYRCQYFKKKNAASPYDISDYRSIGRTYKIQCMRYVYIIYSHYRRWRLGVISRR